MLGNFSNLKDRMLPTSLPVPHGFFRRDLLFIISPAGNLASHSYDIFERNVALSNAETVKYLAW